MTKKEKTENMKRTGQFTEPVNMLHNKVDLKLLMFKILIS